MNDVLNNGNFPAGVKQSDCDGPDDPVEFTECCECGVLTEVTYECSKCHSMFCSDCFNDNNSRCDACYYLT